MSGPEPIGGVIAGIVIDAALKKFEQAFEQANKSQMSDDEKRDLMCEGCRFLLRVHRAGFELPDDAPDDEGAR